jgi:hypothetical protein
MCGLHGVDLNRLGAINSIAPQGAKKHGSYWCNGCLHVSSGYLIRPRSSDRLGYIWSSLSLLELCRLLLLFYV